MRKVQFVCGVDGGGTKTTVLCRTLQGVEVGRREFGPFNYNSIGEEAFKGILSDILSYIESLGTCKALCIGAAGMSNLKAKECALSALSAVSFPCSILCDYEIALTGALDGKEGIALVSGTGSVCFGRTADGRTAMSGGWGHLIGDAGSGYGLGRDALGAVADSFDGIGNKTILTDLVAENLGINNPEKLVSYIYNNDKSAVASVASLVDKACRLGDEVAIRVVSSNAEALVRLVEAVTSRLGFSSCNVALLGGLLENNTCIRERFISMLKEKNSNLTCVPPLHNAVEGAVLEALKLIKV